MSVVGGLVTTSREGAGSSESGAVPGPPCRRGPGRTSARPSAGRAGSELTLVGERRPRSGVSRPLQGRHGAPGLTIAGGSGAALYGACTGGLPPHPMVARQGRAVIVPPEYHNVGDAVRERRAVEARV